MSFISYFFVARRKRTRDKKNEKKYVHSYIFSPFAKKLTMSKLFSIENFKYVVFRTGYTSRITENINKFIDKALDRDLFMDTEEDLGDLSEREYIEKQIMFVYDSCYGIGMDIKRDPKICKAICDAIGKDNLDGTICFRVSYFSSDIGEKKWGNIREVFNMVDVLRETDYCACLDFGNIDEVEMYQTKKGTRFLYIRIDCESG